MQWYDNSCRYNSFFYIYTNVFFSKIKNKENITSIKCFNDISNKILNSNEFDKKLGFWAIIEKYKLDKVAILSKKFNHTIFDSITSFYKFLDNSP